MEVDVTHFVDAGEREATGDYDYYYEGDAYTFASRGERLVVRTYVEDPTTGMVVGLSTRQMREAPLAPEVSTYLRAQSVHTLLALGTSGAYEVWQG